jgi:hypothetical protein
MCDRHRLQSPLSPAAAMQPIHDSGVIHREGGASGSRVLFYLGPEHPLQLMIKAKCRFLPSGSFGCRSIPAKHIQVFRLGCAKLSSVGAQAPACYLRYRQGTFHAGQVCWPLGKSCRTSCPVSVRWCAFLEATHITGTTCPHPGCA